MISVIDRSALDNASRCTSLVLNGHIAWSFLDDYMFTEMQKDANSPMLSMHAEGIVVDRFSKEEGAARLYVFWHEDLKQWSSTLCFLDESMAMKKSLNVTSIKLAK